MSKYTFISEDDPVSFGEGIAAKRTIEFNAVALVDVIQEFQMFLKGAGFVFDGHLDIIEDI